MKIIPLALVACLSVALHGVEEKLTPEQMRPLVGKFLKDTKLELNPLTEIAVEEFTVDGLWDALQLQIVRVGFNLPGQTSFNDAVLLCRQGKVQPFVETFGGYGLMSAVLSDGKLFCTYSWGSGRHRSHILQVSLNNGTLQFVQSPPILDRDVFVKKETAGLSIQEGKFSKFNEWTEPKALGQIRAKDAAFVVLNARDNSESAEFSGTEPLDDTKPKSSSLK